MAYDASTARVRLAAGQVQFFASTPCTGLSAPMVTLQVAVTASTVGAAQPYALSLPTALGFSSGTRFLTADASGGVAFSDGAGIGSSLADIGANTLGWDFPEPQCGATGVVDDLKAVEDAEPPDSVANAFAKVDRWLWTNLIDMPPAPTYVDVALNTTGFTVAWANPLQYTVGFLAGAYVPVINELVLTVSGTDIATSTFLVTTPALLPPLSTALTGVTFTTNAGANLQGSSPPGVTTPTDPAGSTFTVRAGTQSLASLTTSGVYSVLVGFRNNNTRLSSTHYLSTFTGLTLTTGNPPSAPTVTGVTAAGNTLTTALSPPTRVQFDQPNSATSPTLAFYDYYWQTVAAGAGTPAYDYVFGQTGAGYNPYAGSVGAGAFTHGAGPLFPTARRYGGGYAYADDAHNAVVAATVTADTSPALLWDAPYAALAAASNSAAPGAFGAASALAFARTALPAPPAAFGGGALVFDTGAQYGVPGVWVAGRGSGAAPLLPVYNTNNLPSTLASRAVPTALVDPATPGLTSAYVAQLAGPAGWHISSAATAVVAAFSTVSAGTTYAGLDGFDPAALTNDLPFGPRVGLAVTAVGDAYPADAARSGFWRVASVALTLYSTAYTAVAQAPLSLQQVLPSAGTAALSATLYFDGLSGAPAATPSLLSVSGPSTAVCGVTTWAPGAAVNAFVLLHNFANGFVASTIATARLSWQAETLASATYDHTATLYQVTSPPSTQTPAADVSSIGGDRRVYPSLAIPAGQTDVFTGGGAPLTVAAQAWALTGASATASATTLLSTAAAPYVDLPSIVAAAAATRVRSGSGSYPQSPGVDFGGAFDETADLSATYTGEVQLANGLFQTKAAGAGGYQNYAAYAGLAGPNYAGIAASGTRYATFAFAVAAVGAGNNPYNYATLTLPACIAAMSGVTFALAGVTVGVRIVAAGSNQTTAWMDGNAANNNQNIGSLGGSSGAPIFTDGAALILNTAGTGAAAPTASSRPLLMPAGTGATACTVYVRLGMDMSVPTAFGAPTLVLST
jgi:hypothetical protein